jgi:hypothetical protein
VLLLAAAVVMMEAPRLADRRISGSAVAAGVAEQPMPGQCVTGPDRLRTMARPGLPLDDGVLDGGTQLRIAACAGSHIGEVVAVDSAEPAPQAVAIYGFPFSFQVSGCGQSAFRYLGIDPADQGPVGNVGAQGVNWAVTTRAVVAVARPSAEQSAVGQRWVACVLATPESGYAGTARGAYAGSGAPSAFGVCGGRSLALSEEQLATVAATESDCGRPHQAEQFGVAWFGGALPNTAALTRSCTAFAGLVTGLRDVMEGGRLTVRPVALATPGAPKGWREVACTLVVTGTHSLSTTLVGVGDRSLPWR